MAQLDLSTIKLVEQKAGASSKLEQHKQPNVFSVDVEEWFQVGAFENTLSVEDWPALESRVEFQTDNILSLLDQHDIKATFFCLGWVGKRSPRLIERISNAGHEVASHGMNHNRVYEFDSSMFATDISESKKILEDASGRPVRGYRAPSFSMTMEKWHFFEIMSECGYRYSSSVFPAQTDHYGIPDAPRRAFYPIVDQDFIELPMTVCHFGKARLPASGGGYFRLLPYNIAEWLMKRAVKQTDSGVVFYMHPWESDPGQPFVKNAPFKSRFRHYTGQKTLLPRLSRLFNDWQFMRVDEFLHETYGVGGAS